MSQLLRRRRVIVITIGVPHPSTGASVVLFFHYIKSIVDHGAEILHMILLSSDDDAAGSVRAYREALGCTAKITIKVTKSDHPFVPSRFKVRSDFKKFVPYEHVVKEFNPQVGLAFDLAAAGIMNTFNVPIKMVWLGDLAFQSNWHNYLYSYRENWKTMRWIPFAISQFYQWKRLYKNILRGYREIIVSSNSSVKALENLGLEARFAPYPWPAGDLLPAKTISTLPNKPTFLFFGNLVGLGSRSSLYFLFKKLYPILVSRWGHGGFEIIIGGNAKPRESVARAARVCAEIKLVGFIDDLRQCMAGCHAVITPLDVPVGNRSRILTAWSMKALVISHKNASLGNPGLIDGQTAYLASNANDFADKMFDSVSNRSQTAAVVERAYARFKRDYAIENASSLFTNLIHESIS